MTPPQDWLQIHGWIVHFHALLADDGVYLIDSGFVGAVGRLKRRLATVGRSLQDVRAILLTHGHLDHTLNTAQIVAESGAKVFAPRLEAAHIDGTYDYRGISRMCGWAEALGRAAFRYQAPTVDQWIEPGDELPFWGGLRVIGLPGHTHGHVGFFSPSRQLLFSGDLFSNYLGLARRPRPGSTWTRPPSTPASEKRSNSQSKASNPTTATPVHPPPTFGRSAGWTLG